LQAHSANRLFNFPLDVSDSTLSKICLDISLAGMESTREAKLGWDAFNTVSRVDILYQCDLIAGRGSLAGDDGGVGKEIFPNL